MTEPVDTTGLTERRISKVEYTTPSGFSMLQDIIDGEETLAIQLVDHSRVAESHSHLHPVAIQHDGIIEPVDEYDGTPRLLWAVEWVPKEGK